MRDDVDTAGRAARVLIVRCCRAPQFQAAVRWVRARYASVEIVALTHRGYRETLAAAGVDSVVEISGRRFGLFRVSPKTVLRLRGEAFDEIVIPQMTPFGELHSNLYRLAAALKPSRLVVVPGDLAPQTIASSAILRFALRHTLAAVLARFDTPSFLLLLAAACVAPRRSVPARTGRRRVLHIISSLGVGGAQVQLAELMSRTPADEFDLELVVLGRDDGEFSRQWLRRTDVTVSYVQRWPRLALSVLELAARCRAGRYDIVHTWLFMANMVGAAAARLAGVPVVVASVRNLSVWKREASARRWWHRVGDALGSRAADVVTVNAQALVADHARWAWLPRRRMRVIHNGLDPAAFVHDRADSRAHLIELTGAARDAVFVGTVGRLAQEKDQATFVRVIEAVRRARPDVHGVIVGDGEFRAALEALARELGLAHSITFLGRRADARRLVAGLDLFMLTSRSEGFPNVLLEAAFMRVPCVATDIAGNPDVLVDAESLFPVGDVAAGARRVLSTLAEAGRTRTRADLVWRRALDLFTADRSADAWLHLYRLHLGSPRGQWERVRPARVAEPAA